MAEKTMRLSRRLRRARISVVLCYAFIILFGLILLLPLLILAFGSFSKADEVSELFVSAGGFFVPWLFPAEWTMSRYYDTLVRTPQYLRLFWNSCIVTFPAVIGQVVVSCLAGYGFAKFRFKGREALFILLILLMTMPVVVTVVPNFITASFIGLTDTYWAIILPGIFSAFGIFLMRQYIMGIPYSVLEAARSDGAGELRIFFRIVLPNCKSGIAALSILTFIDLWNQVELPVMLLSNPELMPLSVYLGEHADQLSGIGLACCMIFALPALLVFLAGEDYLVDGIEHSQF